METGPSGSKPEMEENPKVESGEKKSTHEKSRKWNFPSELYYVVLLHTFFHGDEQHHHQRWDAYWVRVAD